MATKTTKSRSRAQKRYDKKRAPRPVGMVGGGQGGILSPSGNAGSFWG